MAIALISAKSNLSILPGFRFSLNGKHPGKAKILELLPEFGQFFVNLPIGIAIKAMINASGVKDCVQPAAKIIPENGEPPGFQGQPNLSSVGILEKGKVDRNNRNLEGGFEFDEFLSCAL